VRKRSTAAAPQFEINQDNVMQLFKTHARIMKLEVSNESSAEQRTNCVADQHGHMRDARVQCERRGSRDAQQAPGETGGDDPGKNGHGGAK
jgi:hypothetical protein